MRFLITAGPTREYLDPVRFLSNASSGRLGFDCAAAARRRGHKVTLISGPTHLEKPAGVKLLSVVSADDMQRQVMAHFARCDCVIMTAAVCDYRPQRRAPRKIQKSDRNLILQLTPTPDILAQLGQMKKNRILIGFALQDRAGRQHARRKLIDKNLDAVVLNSPAALAAQRLNAQILPRNGKWQKLDNLTKSALALRLVKLSESLHPKA